MEYVHFKDLVSSLTTLKKKGGPYAKAAISVESVIGRISVGSADPLSGIPLTNHGETRVKKCIKYDLTGHCRLITVQDSGITLLCYVGSHDDCDKWLDRHRGLTLCADGHTKLEVAQASTVEGHLDERPIGPLSVTDGYLYDKLTPKAFDALIEGVARSIVRSLEGLQSIVDENAISSLADEIEEAERATAVRDVFLLLRQDRRSEAEHRVKLFTGELKAVTELSQEEIARLAESQNIKELRSDDPRFPSVFAHFVNSASYMDWMLFLHPDQQQIVDADFSGPTKLIGVSGSGKTCILVHRAIRLAAKYPEKRILVLTLNRQLSNLIRDMADAACTPDLREQIHVVPFFELCQGMLHEFEPGNDKLYDDVTWKGLEHIDEVWREFYRCELNNQDASVLIPVHDSLIARGVDAEQYIREEFDWIRSAVPPQNRHKYLKLDRAGRSYPLDEKFRKRLLEGLQHWETKMVAVGVTDYLGLSTALLPYKNRIHAQYKSVLIDESQDFGTIEYSLIRQLAEPGENDLFFCGDAAQQVSTKHRRFRDAGVEIHSSRSLTIMKNYRNSREILTAANQVLMENLTEELFDSQDFEMLDPEFANFNGSAPLMLYANDFRSEIAHAIHFINSELEDSTGKKGCIAMCGFTLYEVQQYGNAIGLGVLDGNTVTGDGSIYLSDLEHTKGFEFDVVVIVNCSNSVLPDVFKPEKEQFRDLARFYVAMTRAKNQLVVSWSGSPSTYLGNSESNFLVESWGNYQPIEKLSELPMPRSLDCIRGEVGEDSEIQASRMDLSGPEFLYTSAAIGLDSQLIDKLRTAVPGRRRTVDRIPIEWATLREASSDTASTPRSRQVFGPEGIVKFRELIDRIGRASKNHNKK